MKHPRETREIALYAYVASGSWGHAARAAGVDERTVRRWWAATDEKRRRAMVEDADAMIGTRVRHVLAMAVDHAAARLEAGDEQLSVVDAARVVQSLASAAGRLADRAMVQEQTTRELKTIMAELARKDPRAYQSFQSVLAERWPSLGEEPDQEPAKVLDS